MRLLDNMRLALKLPLLLAMLALTALLVMGVTSYRVARSALLTEGQNRLLTALEVRQLQLNGWYSGLSKDSSAHAESPMTVKVMRDFINAWSRIPGIAATIFAGASSRKTPTPPAPATCSVRPRTSPTIPLSTAAITMIS